MSCRLEPTIWSRDIGQHIPCFDRCQLFITWMSDIKEVHGKPRLHVSINLLFEVSMAAMLRDSTVVVAVVRTRPRAIPLPMITMRKSIHGFLFPYMLMGLRLAAFRAAGASLKLIFYNGRWVSRRLRVSFRDTTPHLLKTLKSSRTEQR